MNNPQVERLAYWLWQQRGMPTGSPDEDWLLAEELLKSRPARSFRSSPCLWRPADRRRG
ncbi:MAG: DUF2934 domain-containing protein [Acidobacteriia bacterium]|nr:DUF2934 domain-containing protein [Terriglobia bacterium]